MFPLVSDGVTAQFATVAQQLEVETHFDYGELAIAMALCRLDLVIREGRATELVDSYMHPFRKPLLGSCFGMFPGSWRSSIKWFSIVGSSVGVVLLLAGASAHAGRSQAFYPDDSPGRMLQDVSDVKEFRGSPNFA